MSFIQGAVVRNLVVRVGEAHMIAHGVVMMGGGLWLMALAGEQHSTSMLLWTMPLIVCGFAFITPSVQGLISRRTDPARQGSMMGVNQSTSALARIVGPISGNLLFGIYFSLPYKMGALLMIPAFLIALACAREGKDWAAESA